MLHTQYKKLLFPFYVKLLKLLLRKSSKVTSKWGGNLSTVQSTNQRNYKPFKRITIPVWHHHSIRDEINYCIKISICIHQLSVTIYAIYRNSTYHKIFESVLQLISNFKALYVIDWRFVSFHVNPHVGDYSAFRWAFIFPLKEWYIIQCVTRPRKLQFCNLVLQKFSGKIICW